MALRTVGGGGDADLDMRAITDEQDIVELPEASGAPENGRPNEETENGRRNDATAVPRAQGEAPVPELTAAGLCVGVLIHDSQPVIRDASPATARVARAPQPSGLRSRPRAAFDGGVSARSRRMARSRAAATPWRSLELGRVGRAAILAVVALAGVSAAAIILGAGAGARRPEPANQALRNQGRAGIPAPRQPATSVRQRSQTTAGANGFGQRTRHANGRVAEARARAPRASVSHAARAPSPARSTTDGSTSRAPAEQTAIAPRSPAPTQQASTQQAPEQQAPTQQTPAVQAPAQQTPAVQAPAQQTPALQQPVQQASESQPVNDQTPSEPAGPTGLGAQVGGDCNPKCS